MEEKGKAVICGVCSTCRCNVGCAAGVVVQVGEEQKMCQCGAGMCKILTSKKDISKGRRFYCCPRSTGANNHGCGMFEWVKDREGGRGSISNICACTPEDQKLGPSPNVTTCTSSYARGYLDGAIRGSEQQTHALKNILDALTKLNVNKK